MPPRDQLLLYLATFLAGLLNATVGGGGLIQVPTMMLVMPAAPLATILGTSKLAGVPGLGGAVATFVRRQHPVWPLIVRVSLVAMPCAVLGARVATLLPPALARPIALTIIVAMSAFVFLQPRFGERPPTGPLRLGGPLPWLIGAVVGFYEGFFGTGSGTILIVLFVWLHGLDLMAASIASAIVTLAGAGAALVAFLVAGHVLVPLALRMTGFNIAGALIGARLITLRGNTGLHRLLVAVLAALIIKLTWDQFAR